jgi:hypothetical protein
MRPAHWHRDPNWQVRDAWRYDQCRCGARRTRLYHWAATFNRIGQPYPDWPPTFDRHGIQRFDSGWMPEPAGGWPVLSTRSPRPPKGGSGQVLGDPRRWALERFRSLNDPPKEGCG